jgi:hypothetical protein
MGGVSDGKWHRGKGVLGPENERAQKGIVDSGLGRNGGALEGQGRGGWQRQHSAAWRRTQ